MSLPSKDDSNVGTNADMVSRLRATLPTGWFPVSPPAPAASITPVLDGLLAGLAEAWSVCFDLLSLVTAQTRLGTAFGAFLDMISVDFLGSYLPRKADEPDDSFRGRISTSLISRRGTRQDVCRAVTEVTSAVPAICEPTRGADCGGYAGFSDPEAGGGLGYNISGLSYGSRLLAFQYLLNISGYATFAPGEITARQSPATFVDGDGLVRLVSPRVLRPKYQQGVCVGALLEANAFNLIINSQLWSDFSQPKETGGSSASWYVDYVTPGLFTTDPIMMISGGAGTRMLGPSVDIAAAGAVICGSAWIFIDVGSTLVAVELVATDLNVAKSSVYVMADMTLLGQWQRLSISLQTQAAAGRNLRIGLVISGPSVQKASLRTQCWQAELGKIPTSYIPTTGTLGIRAQDYVISLRPTIGLTAFTNIDVLNAVASTIPAATTAWTAISPAYVIG